MTGGKSKTFRDGGVSESIGFLLIFTMVIAGIGLVTLYGYPLLLQQQTSADEQIMEKNMVVLQNDVKSLAYKTVPYTETSMKVGSGSLTVYNTSSSSPSSTIQIYDNNGIGYLSGYNSGDLRYESISADRDISLQDGAVISRNIIENGSAMLAEPRWFYDSPTNTMVVNLIGINSTDILSRVGISTVQMELGSANFTSYTISPGTIVSLEFTPDPLHPVQDYSVAWDNYFTNTLKMTRSSGLPDTGAPVTYQLPFDTTRTGTLTIKKYDVNIESL